MPHLAIGFFFLRRIKYEIAKVRYFPGEKLYIKAFSSFFLIIINRLSIFNNINLPRSMLVDC
jgi:hypothetical protein